VDDRPPLARLERVQARQRLGIVCVLCGESDVAENTADGWLCSPCAELRPSTEPRSTRSTRADDEWTWGESSGVRDAIPPVDDGPESANPRERPTLPVPRHDD
jgi:hypothetical protein